MAVLEQLLPACPGRSRGRRARRRPGPRSIDVVGGADRLLVVLDDDHGVAEIAQPRRASPAACGCRAGAGRSTARRARRARRSGSRRSASPAGCAALRRPTASRRCGRASGSRRRRRRRKRRRSRISRRMRLGDQRSRARSARAPRRPSQRLGDRQVDVLGDRPALDPHRQALRLAAARRGRPGTAAARDTARGPPARPTCPLRSGGAGSGITPSKPRAERILGARAPSAFLLARRRLARRAGAGRARRRTGCRACFFGSLPNGSVEIDAEDPAERAERLAHQLACRPCAHGAIAPSASDSDSSGTTRAGSKSYTRAQPLALRAGAVRRVERERARRHLRHADAAVRCTPAGARTADRRRRAC